MWRRGIPLTRCWRMLGVGGDEAVVLRETIAGGWLVFWFFLLFFSCFSPFFLFSSAFFYRLFLLLPFWPEWLQRWFVVGVACLVWIWQHHHWWRIVFSLSLSALCLCLCGLHGVRKKMRQEDMIPTALFFMGGASCLGVFGWWGGLEERGVAASLLCCCCLTAVWVGWKGKRAGFGRLLWEET